jgi:hypothetical protein
VAIGLVVVGIIAALGAVFVMNSSDGDSVPIAAAIPTETPAPTETLAPTETPAATPTRSSVPTATAVPETATPRPTFTPPDTPIPPTGTPPDTPIPPTATPTDTPIPPTDTPTPTPQEVFRPLKERFHVWKSRWIENYGEPPILLEEGVLNNHKYITLPMCGIVDAEGGFAFGGFQHKDSLSLGRYTIALSGRHSLNGSAAYLMDYSVKVRLPDLLGEGSVTTKYNNDLRTLLDSCGG